MAKGRKRFNSGFKNWKVSQLPDLKGRHYVITGGNSGIGFEAARILGEAGADVTIACRDEQKAQSAKTKLEASSKGKLFSLALDLASLDSVRLAAAELKTHVSKIDGLINNAGIMQTPYLKTADNFEMQIGTNHLGHFLWTALLFDCVEAAEGRIVTVSSVAHKFGKINFDDLMSENSYSATMAYCQSKLANLIFAMELDRQLQLKNRKVKSIACHPGYAATNLQSTGPSALLAGVYKVLNAVVAQPMKNGAIPSVLAAAGKEARAGGYYGPQLFSEARGRVSDAVVMDTALDQKVAEKLWQESEALVGQSFQV